MYWIKMLFNIVALLLFTIAFINTNRLHKLAKTEIDEETFSSRAEKSIPILIRLMTLGLILSIIAVFL